VTDTLANETLVNDNRKQELLSNVVDESPLTNCPETVNWKPAIEPLKFSTGSRPITRRCSTTPAIARR